MAISDTLKLQVLFGMADKLSVPMRAMGKDTKRTFDRINDLNAELKKLGTTEKDIGQFRALKRSLPAAAREARSARDKLHALETQLTATDAPSRKLSRSINAARNASTKATDQWRSQASQLRAVRTRMTSAGVSTRSLRQDEGRLRERLDSTNRALKTQKDRLADVHRAQAKLEKLRNRFHRRQQNAANLSVGGFAGMAAGRGILSPVIGSLKKGAQFQATLRDQAITGDLTAAQEQALGAAVRAQARRWGVPTQEVFKATDSLVAAGINDTAKLKQSAALLTKVQVATNAEMEDLGNLAVSLRQNLGINKDMAATFDALDYAGKAGKFELKDMAKWMPKLGAAMQSMGGHGKRAAASLAAAMQVVRMGAGTSDEAGNNLQNFMKKMTSQVTRQNFAKLGIDYKKRMEQFAGRGVGPIVGSVKLIQEALAKRSPEASAELMAAANSKNDTERAAHLQRVQQLSKSFGLGELFNDQQAMAAILPLLANMDKFRQIRDQSLNAKGTVDKDAAKRMQTLTKQWSKAHENVMDLAISVSQFLGPAVTKLLGLVTALAQKIQAWTKKHPKLTAAIVKTATVLGGLLVVFGGLALALAAVMTPLAMFQFGFGRLRLAMRGLSGIFKLTGGDIRGLGRGVKWLGKPLGVFGGHLVRLSKLLGQGLFTGAGKAIGIVGKLGRILAGAGLKGLLAVAKGARIVGRVMLVLGRALLANPILLILGAIGLAAYEIWKHWDVIKPALMAVWNAIKNAAVAVWNAIKAAIKAVIDWVSDKIDWIKSKWDKFKGIVSDIGKSQKQIAQTGAQLAFGKKQSFSHRLLGGSMLALTAAINPVALGAIGQHSDQVKAAVSTASARSARPAGTVHETSTTTIHVHPSAGMDEKALAHHMRTLLDERDRQKAAARRSALGDLD